MHIVGEDLVRVLYCVGKILQGIWEKFLYKNDPNDDSYKFSYKFTFIPFLSLHINQKQESNFQQVLLQKYAEFNRLLQKDFLICYSCSYYSFMIVPNPYIFGSSGKVSFRERYYIYKNTSIERFDY